MCLQTNRPSRVQLPVWNPCCSLPRWLCCHGCQRVPWEPPDGLPCLLPLLCWCPGWSFQPGYLQTWQHFGNCNFIFFPFEIICNLSTVQFMHFTYCCTKIVSNFFTIEALLMSIPSTDWSLRWYCINHWFPGTKQWCAHSDGWSSCPWWCYRYHYCQEDWDYWPSSTGGCLP